MTTISTRPEGVKFSWMLVDDYDMNAFLMQEMSSIHRYLFIDEQISVSS